MTEEPESNAIESARTAATELSQTEWQLDAEPVLELELAEPPPEAPAPPPQAPTPSPAPASRRSASLFPSTVDDTAEALSPDQLIEAMLFAGGAPLTAEKAGSVVRGLTPEVFRETVDRLAVKYRRQQRPYAVRPREDGFVLLLRADHQGLPERLFGGPREARLSPVAIDVLSLVAYRQPVTKAQVDALRGADSGAALRQLVRLGLIAASKNADATRQESCYQTTGRFLELFQIQSLAELPKIGDSPD